MKLLFVHSHQFHRVNGRIYSSGDLQQDIMERYVRWFGDVTVLGRIKDEKQEKSAYMEINHPNIHIVDDTEMVKLVRHSDALIIRLPSRTGYRAVFWAKKYQKPYLIEAVACIWDAYWNYGMKGKAVAFPAMKIMQKCIRDASYVVYVTHRFLQSRYPSNGRTAAISDVELMSGSINTLKKRLDRIRNRRYKKLLIGTIAAIDVPHKGQEYMIRALLQIRFKLGIDIEYQMVGGGNQDRLRKISRSAGVENNIRFLGVMRHEEIFEWLDQIDIYVQPSFQEGLCRSLIEAMSRGLPCIASNAGGNPELICGRYLISVQEKNTISDKLAKAVCSIFQDNQMQKEAKSNFQYVNHRFQKEVLEKKRDHFYLEFKNEVQKSCQKSV